MLNDPANYYRAFAAKDTRYDGVFFVGVTSTGIYCRPVCPARLPKESNCRFFPDASAARKEGFRACLRCRPELVPGSAPVDDARRVAQLFVQRTEDGTIALDTGVEDLAQQFDLSVRQFSRVIQNELGETPLRFLKIRKLTRAEKFLRGTRLPITEIAYKSGFSSLRSFNQSFLTYFGTTPSAVRKSGNQ